MENKNTNGSVWRKWDLHLHTPGTKKNDRFIGTDLDDKWNRFITSINSSPQEIAVVGITDYLSIDNYFKFKSLYNSGVFTKKFDMIMPNVELRALPVSGSSTPINLHCIFNPDFDTEIESRFFNKLCFNNSYASYTALKRELIRFGRDFTNDSNLAEDAAYSKGIVQFIINIDNLREVFNNDVELKENTFIVISNNSNDGVTGVVKHSDFFINSNESQLESTRRSFYQLADSIFSGNDSDYDYFAGMGPDNIETVIRKCGTLKPCYHGCDAHDNNKIFNPDLDRFCWIKADTTFNGLKQTLYEPTERVKIQKDMPEQKNDYQVIESITINHSDFGSQTIPFNPNLNTIIGGKSSGKSILLGSIAKKIISEVIIKEQNPDYDKFIRESVAPAMNINWRDGVADSSRNISYYRQSYINSLAANSIEVNKLIEGIIKNEEVLRDALESYSTFCIANKKDINLKISEMYEFKEKLNDKKQKFLKIGNRSGIEKQIEKIKNELEEIRKAMQPAITEEENDEYLSNTEVIESLKDQIILVADRRDRLKEISEFKISNNISEELFGLGDDLVDRIKKFYMEIEDDFKSKFITGMNEFIKLEDERYDNIKNEIMKIIDSEKYSKCTEFYNKNESYTETKKKLDDEMNNLGEIIKTEDDIKIDENRINKLSSEIKELHYLYYFKASELSGKLIYPREDIEITSNISFNSDKYQNAISQKLNRKSHEAQSFVEFSYTSFDAYKEKIELLFQNILNESLTLKGGYNHQQVIIDIFADSFFELYYDVKYQDDNLSSMSEGKKAFIVLKILLDFSNEKCPILIDQPEDDLDNRAIYDQLVEYLRKKKKERQIILVTHNPNIVVGADAEEIIVANQHGVNSPNQDNIKFEYLTGSLENSKKKDNAQPVLIGQGIKQHVCELLEGGDEAFKKREKKYGIKR